MIAQETVNDFNAALCEFAAVADLLAARATHRGR